MDPMHTGKLIRALRLQRGATQRELAEALGVSADALLKGEIEHNARSNGNLNKLRFHVCPLCPLLRHCSRHGLMYQRL